MMQQSMTAYESTARAPNWSPLVRRLKSRFQLQGPIGYLCGKSKIRNAVADELNCSLADADQIVEQLEERGYLTYNGYTYSVDKIPETWEILPPETGR